MGRARAEYQNLLFDTQARSCLFELLAQSIGRGELDAVATGHVGRYVDAVPYDQLAIVGAQNEVPRGLPYSAPV